MRSSQVMVEGKYDSFVLKITRDITHHLRDLKDIDSYEPGDGDIQRVYEWPFRGQHLGRGLMVIFRLGAELEDFDDVTVEGEYQGGKGRLPRVIIDVNVTVDSIFDNGAPDVTRLLHTINTNVQRTVAHELEHLLQDRFRSDKSTRPEIDPTVDAYSDDDNFEYLLAPHEVEAHVRGFYLQAKRLRVSLSKIIDNVIGQYTEMGLLTDEQAQEVSQVWKSWAAKNLPASKL